MKDVTLSSGSKRKRLTFDVQWLIRSRKAENKSDGLRQKNDKETYENKSNIPKNSNGVQQDTRIRLRTLTCKEWCSMCETSE